MLLLLLLLQSEGYSNSQGMKGAAVVVFLICSCKSLDQSPTYGQSLLSSPLGAAIEISLATNWCVCVCWAGGQIQIRKRSRRIDVPSTK